MTGATDVLEGIVGGEYRYGFVTDLAADVVPVGLDESVVRLTASKHDEPEWLVQWRLGALRH
jgi:Fe-S cluster assembly protein SufB